MGPYEESLIAQHSNIGSPLPDKILNKPVLFISLQFILEAFFELDSERHHGMGYQKIPWSAIMTYAHFHEITGTELEEFLFLIRGLDNHNLNSISNK